MCPITQIIFVKGREIALYQADTTNYTVKSIPGLDDEYLVYSKTADSLPIIKTQVETDIPCVNPNQVSGNNKW